MGLKVTGGGRDVFFAEDPDKVGPGGLEIGLGDIVLWGVEVCEGSCGGGREGGGFEGSEVVCARGEEDESCAWG